MNVISQVSCVMMRALNKRVLIITMSREEADRWSNALREWCRQRGIKCKMYFEEQTFYVPGYNAVTFIDAVSFNEQHRHTFDGEVYAASQDIITTLEKAPMPIDYVYEVAR